jgi:O-succinylbenzoate synthase
VSQGLRRVDVRVPLREPVRGVIQRHATLVQGVMGWGESSPLPGYPVAASTCAAAAIEAATLGLPDPVRRTVPVNALISDLSPVEAAARAALAVADGYRTVKVKVGDADDLERAAAVRDAIGPDVALRLDANGAWDLDTARSRLRQLAALNPEYVEEPVPGIDDMARLRLDVTVPIAADESVRSHDDVRRLAARRAVDVLVLKVQACGGAVRALHWAEDAGVPVVVTSMLETSVGLAAGLAAAAALPELPFACGLGTGALLAGDVVADPLIPQGGALEVRRPVPDEDLLERYAIEVSG